MLLCNLFLGLELDAYVCVGRVQTESMTTEGLQEHCWVMTREPDNSSWPKRIQEVMTLQFVLGSHERKSVHASESMQCLCFGEQKRSQEDDEESSKQTDMNDQTKIDEESFYKFIEQHEAKFDLLEKEGINQPYEIFVEGVGMGDGVGKLFERLYSAERIPSSLVVEYHSMTLNSNTKHKHRYERRDQEDVCGSRGNEFTSIKGEQHKQKKERVEMRVGRIYGASSRHVKEHQNQKGRNAELFPYKEIFAVFNAHNYWVNTHRLVLEKPQRVCNESCHDNAYDMGGDYEANRDWEPFKTSARCRSGTSFSSHHALCRVLWHQTT